jgi:hypothetical protein
VRRPGQAIRRGRAWTWIAAAALAAPLLLFFACFEPVKVEEPGGYGPEARANPFLAAERLLNRRGHPAWNERDSLELPSATDTVILLGSQPLPSNHDLDSLARRPAGTVFAGDVRDGADHPRLGNSHRAPGRQRRALSRPACRA